MKSRDEGLRENMDAVEQEKREKDAEICGERERRE
jgi:hypothetical protein